MQPCLLHRLVKKQCWCCCLEFEQIAQGRLLKCPLPSEKPLVECFFRRPFVGVETRRLLVFSEFQRKRKEGYEVTSPPEGMLNEFCDGLHFTYQFKDNPTALWILLQRTLKEDYRSLDSVREPAHYRKRTRW